MIRYVDEHDTDEITYASDSKYSYGPYDAQPLVRIMPIENPIGWPFAVGLILTGLALKRRIERKE
jgi:hypothetical protein